MMRLGFSAFFLLLPMIIWMVVIAVIIKAVNGNFNRSSRARNMSRPTRPTPQKGLFDMKPAQKSRKSIFQMGKSGYDTYTSKGRKKDVVTGYDERYSSKQSYMRAAGRQYSHTYNGHEPWDKCLPKEKDPWDKDFYV